MVDHPDVFPKTSLPAIDDYIKAFTAYDEVIAKLEKMKETGRIFFTTADISYLKSGGRLGKLMSIANNILKIKPLILFKDGEIFPSGIVLIKRYEAV